MQQEYVLLITLATAALGIGMVVTWALRSRPSTPGALGVRGGGALQMPCTSCNRPLMIAREELIPLSKPEIALCVRVKPELSGMSLAEYVCPYCEASHCLAVTKRTIEWVGANLYSPHRGAARCMDCGKILRTPPWPRGAYDGRLKEAPNLLPDHGLVCSKCQAVVCVACTEKATRNRTKDGSYVCPRCSRSPVDRTYHPA
ncbi:MAG: hypothetical protein IT365_23235 [Candidatus Hydrogenedentes bacterium]|nr:hypothetical protein [Candidatus Hydrogenedentota bacterium]